MNGKCCPVCLQNGEKKNLRRMNKKNRHRDAKLRKTRRYRCKSCGWQVKVA